ncbi:hypothetical protein AK812_SmicGene10252 [Symbiodinium microadriaticum]|uniref:Uncharacterized protein n=1 Tax=Symbiodinium microadriaticum TaxID=2951 RepID=A0A1Q9EGI7_SYMMI|nr:hypothetical protein AK812_SmicGene10252 [Symbiodinium microadriaticum]
MSRAMAGEQPLSARSSDGPASMQQKMMRQRELVLKRQTEAAKSFGVVAQQHPPPRPADTPRQVLSARALPDAPRVGIVGSAEVQEAVEAVVEHEIPQAQPQEYSLASLEEELLASGKAIELDEAEDRGRDHLGHGWDLEVDRGDEKQTRAKRSFWRPWKAEQSDAVANCPVDEVSRVDLDALSGDSPEPGRDRKHVGFGEMEDGISKSGATSALNMGRVATPWTGSSKAGLDSLLPGELQQDMTLSSSALEIVEEGVA